MIEAHALTKKYGQKTAVDSITFTVRPGQVTGLLGPNGAGKSTTMRMIVGLDRPTSGSVTVDGVPFAQHTSPLGRVGALLDAKAMHPGRSAFHHLAALAATNGIPTRRVHEVIALTGLDSVAKRRTGGFSLGMGQRLGIATALLGDPSTLILDEPINGLDPEGVVWVRQLLRHLASEGRTILLSSHLMSEMAMTADHILVVGRGRIIADGTVDELVAAAGTARVRVRTSAPDLLVAALRAPGVTITEAGERGVLDVEGLDAGAVGAAAASAGIPLSELSTLSNSLEDAYLSLTQNEVEYRTQPERELSAAGTHAKETN